MLYYMKHEFIQNLLIMNVQDIMKKEQNHQKEPKIVFDVGNDGGDSNDHNNNNDDNDAY